MVEVMRHTVNGIQLAVETRRPDRVRHTPVVLLAGAGVTARDWDDIALDLARDRVVHAVDMRGHGVSDWPGVYTFDEMAEDLRLLLAEFTAPPDIVGHSLGGLVAAKALAPDPTVARRLVLEDVGLPRPREPEPPRRPRRELDFDWEVMEQISPRLDHPSPQWPTTLAAITIPTLAIGGGPSSSVSQASITALVGLLSQGQEAMIDAGHQIHTARPEEFLRAVRGFLD